MSKTITLTYKGNEYTLEYTRRTVKQLERSGFALDTERPMLSAYELFKGAFRAHHKNLNNTLIDEMFDNCGNINALTEPLVEMYSSAFEDTEVETDEEGNGAVGLKVNF